MFDASKCDDDRFGAEFGVSDYKARNSSLRFKGLDGVASGGFNSEEFPKYRAERTSTDTVGHTQTGTGGGTVV